MWGKDREHPCPLWTCRCPQFSMCSPSRKLSKHSPLGFSDGFIIQARFEPLTPLFPTGQGAGTKSYIPLITWLVLTWQQAPILSWGSQSHLIGITMPHWHYIFWLHSGNSRGFRSSVPGTKTKYIFLIINHNIIVIFLKNYFL